VVAALRAENAELTAENADLRARITELAGGSRGWKRLISRNRGIRRCRRALMTCRAGRPPSAGRAAGVVAGKQPGAPGAYLAWREVPGKTEDLLPGQPIVHLTYALAGPPFAGATFANK